MNALQELETTSDFQDIRLIMFDFIGIIGRKTQEPTKLMAIFVRDEVKISSSQFLLLTYGL